MIRNVCGYEKTYAYQLVPRIFPGYLGVTEICLKFLPKFQGKFQRRPLRYARGKRCIWNKCIFWVKVIILVTFLLSLRVQAETAVKIEASVDKSKVSTGERFTYTLTVKGIFQKPKLEPPEFKGFRIVSQSQSQNYSFRQSGTELALKLIYVLLALEPGKFTINPAVLKDKTGEYKSNLLAITVEGKSLPEKQKILPYLQNSTDL